MSPQDNAIQDLQLRLIELVEYNELDGKRVVKDLVRDRDLWRAVIIDREGTAERINLIKLRDLPQGIWNVDTLFLLPEKGRENELETLARTWKADEIDWIGGEEASAMLGGAGFDDPSNPRRVLRIWWD